MIDRIINITAFGIPLLIIALIFVGVYFENVKQERWNQFKSDHQCKEIAFIKGDVFNTININPSGGISVGVGATPDKTGWKCDDGKTYFR